MNTPTPPASGNPPIATLLTNLVEIIRAARQQALRTIDTLHVLTCWQIGRHIVEFEQQGNARAAYGKKLLPSLAKELTRLYGKGFDTTNLRHMRGFFLAFPKYDAVRRELSWTHYRTLLRVDSADARQW